MRKGEQTDERKGKTRKTCAASTSIIDASGRQRRGRDSRRAHSRLRDELPLAVLSSGGSCCQIGQDEEEHEADQGS